MLRVSCFPWGFGNPYGAQRSITTSRDGYRTTLLDLFVLEQNNRKLRNNLSQQHSLTHKLSNNNNNNNPQISYNKHLYNPLLPIPN